MIKRKVGWSITHQEFTFTDYYYFSIFQNIVKENNIHIEEVKNFYKLENYDTIVFNYPEIPFKEEEANYIERLVKEKGKKVLLLGYYKNEDNIGDICNTLSKKFNIYFNKDIITDKVNNFKNDPYFLVTSHIFHISSIKKVMLACSDTLKIDKSSNKNIKILIKAEDTAVSNLQKDKILFAEFSSNSGGKFIVGGNCIFWDNYSINVLDNKKLAISLLL